MVPEKRGLSSGLALGASRSASGRTSSSPWPPLRRLNLVLFLNRSGIGGSLLETSRQGRYFSSLSLTLLVVPSAGSLHSKALIF